MKNRNVIFLTIEKGSETKHIICHDDLKEVQQSIFKETGDKCTLKECDSFIEEINLI